MPIKGAIRSELRTVTDSWWWSVTERYYCFFFFFLIICCLTPILLPSSWTPFWVCHLLFSDLDFSVLSLYIFGDIPKAIIHKTDLSFQGFNFAVVTVMWFYLCFCIFYFLPHCSFYQLFPNPFCTFLVQSEMSLLFLPGSASPIFRTYGRH